MLLTGGVNHTTCCTLESVPEYCLPLCSGDVVSSAVNISCLSHVDNIVNCLQQTLGICHSDFQAPPKFRTKDSVGLGAAMTMVWASVLLVTGGYDAVKHDIK